MANGVSDMANDDNRMAVSRARGLGAARAGVGAWRWQRVTADTLWLSGAGTFLANGSLAEENGACFRSLTRLEIDNAGHMLHLERPVEVAARIVDWLEPSGGWPVQ